MKKLLYKWALKLVAKRINDGETKLTPQHLLNAGWVKEYYNDKVFLVEPLVKQRDKISIEFENKNYRVWHGPNRTFIAVSHSIEWLEAYKFLMDTHRTFKKPEHILIAE